MSVSLLTYNQRAWVGRAIDSILAQRVNFRYEIIIGDDCSDDGTQEVLRDYQRRYPDRIFLILHPRRYNHIPGRINNLTNLRACRGRYTAMLDGDDYWTDPNKLQKQFDLMEARADVAMCVHETAYEYAAAFAPTGHRYRYVSEAGGCRRTGIYRHEDIACENRLRVHIGSLFFRTRIYEQVPAWFMRILPADRALMLLISQHGNVYYDAQPGAVYYRNNAGFTAKAYLHREGLEQRIRDVLTFADNFPIIKTQRNYLRSTAWMHFRLFKLSLREYRVVKCWHHLKATLRADVRFPLVLSRNYWTTLKRSVGKA